MRISPVLLFILWIGSWRTCAGKLILADVTSNKLTRQHDGSLRLWSFHGVAKKSHASKTHFIYNADLLTSDGSHHIDIASSVYPSLGLTSDHDPIYQEYLILQAKVVGMDGFMIEWGYQNHSSDEALKSYLTLAQNHTPFKLAVNWCDHWLASELTNKSSQEVINVFHRNLQYLMDTLYSSPVGLYHHDNPVIFLFGGGLTLRQFRVLQSMPLDLPPGAKPPLWIGSFLNFAATPALWEEWGSLLNGTFGWSPHVTRPTPANMSEWDFYGTVDDAVQYQRNVSQFGDGCLHGGRCVLWCGSASPGFDNKGCAAWGDELRYLPRLDRGNHSRSTYDAQWDYHISSKTSAEYIIIPTMNDFPEATPIIDVNSSVSSLHGTLMYAGQWKNATYDPRGLVLCPVWYQLYKEMQFYNRTPGINVKSIEDSFQAAKLAISQGTQSSLSKASILIQNAKDLLVSLLKSNITSEDILIPVPSSTMSFSLPPVIENGSYIINETSQIYLHMGEETASRLRLNNFKGLLRFQYQPLLPGLSYMRVKSSSVTHKLDPAHEYTSYSKGLGKEARCFKHTVKPDRSEVCKIHVNGSTSGSWQNATIAMYKENISWDHSESYKSDLVFASIGSFAIRNISLRFTIFSKR
nr:uncharacterized protein LOC129269100 [Lytechinus pictus]